MSETRTPAPEIYSQAVCDVIAERVRQVVVRGWTPQHDDSHDKCELARAAACYALAPSPVGIEREWVYPDSPKNWPWSGTWWKPGFYRRNLVKACALLIAEIERWDRISIQAIPVRPTESAAEVRPETFETIRQWGETTFGPITIARTFGRASEEFDELRDAPDDLGEAADVVICLARYPGLWAEVERKMGVNRGRRWRLMGDGTGYHIKDASSDPAATAAEDGAR